MKNKTRKQILAVMVAASSAFSGLVIPSSAAVAHAEEASEAEVKETEAEEPGNTAADVELEVDGTSVTLKNETGILLTASLREEADESDEDSKSSGALVLTEEDGEEHMLEGVDLTGITDPVLTEENGFLYLEYEDENGETCTAVETAEEKSFEEPVAVFAVDDTEIFVSADSTSDTAGQAEAGTELIAVGAAPLWIRVQMGDLEGYVERGSVSSQLSDDAEADDGEGAEEDDADNGKSADGTEAGEEEAVDGAVTDEEAAMDAQAAAEAAAKAAAEAAAQAAEAGTDAGSGEDGEKVEVSRQQFDDCDGSGHGYYEITYSDGSVEIEEY